MEIKKIGSDSPYIEQLIKLSYDWEKENSCEGYFHNDIKEFENKEIYIVLEEQEVIAYLFGAFEISEKNNTVQKIGNRIFYIDEIFVREQHRNKGIGNELYNYVESQIKDKVDLILLSTATKDYKKILHFYVDDLGLTFWHAMLYKKLR